MYVWFVWGLCKSIRQTNGKHSRGEKAKRRKRWKWEEKNGTYNPDTSLMQSQASPWSSALAEAAQRSLGLGNGIPTHTKTRPEGGRGGWGRGRITGRVGGGTKTGGRKQRDKYDWEDKQMEGKTEWFSEMRKPDWLWGCIMTDLWPLYLQIIPESDWVNYAIILSSTAHLGLKEILDQAM